MAIVTIRKPAKQHDNVPEMTPEEHKWRGDAAKALFQEMMRGDCDDCGGFQSAAEETVGEFYTKNLQSLVHPIKVLKKLP